MVMQRREFLAGAGLGLLAFDVGGVITYLTPRAARANDVPLQILTPDEARCVEALGDTLLPGASEAGLAHYLDQQLAAPPAESLLMIRYLDVPPPYAAFYKPCIAATIAAMRAKSDRPFDELAAGDREGFVEDLQKGALTPWPAPPSPFFYFVLRADAVDVVYGTPEGFAKLGIPYMPHIMPPRNW